FKMIEAEAILLAAAEHHGGGRAHPQRVSDAVHVFPFVGSALAPRDARANFIVKNFGAAAGNRIEPRGHEARDRLAHAQAGTFGDAADFRSGKTVQMDPRKPLFE